ncbi:MAG: glutathione S-transferase [Alphaproteobacteria bacterium]|nr:glutathione S-transferase [Alphaproteobacteria bacterium]
MLRILGNRRSINVRKVLWTCDEIGLAYTLEAWGADGRSTREPAFLALNPKGLVPVVFDGDDTLTESNTVTRYLAASHGRVDLLPASPIARARIESWMDWQASDLNSAWRTAFQALVRGNRDAGTPAQVSASLASWNGMMALIDRHLAQAGPHVCGDGFTVADIVIGLSVNRWLRAPIERPELPHVRGYFHRLASRPAARPHLGDGTD